MLRNIPTMTDVLVVGAGPCGLMLAGELLRHGVTCRIVDQAAAPAVESRAIGVHARTLEVMEDVGVADELVEHGRRAHGANVWIGGRRSAHIVFDELESRYPFILMIPQSKTEAILTALLGRRGGVVERNVRLEALREESEGIAATLVHGDGRREEARAKWIVGCDGAHSTVRKQLGLAFEGEKMDEAFIVADVILDWDLVEDENHAFLGQGGAFVALPMPGERRWRIVAEIESDGGPPRPRTIEEVRRLVRSRVVTAEVAGRLPPEIGVEDGGWISEFRIHRRMVGQYRKGRAFLAGDAAHIHSPVGGQGMNTGLQDAFNLAWKLALVARGVGRPELLDTYDPERRPIAAATLKGTDLATKAVTIRHPVAVALQSRLASMLTSLEVVQTRVTRMASGLAIDYRDGPLAHEDRAPVLQAPVFADRSKEIASVKDWLDFGAAPRAGERAPDAELAPGQRLHSVIGKARHVVLLFDGAAATAEGYRRLAEIAASVKTRCGDRAEAFVVLPRAERPSELPATTPVLHDAAGALHRRYGAGAECAYVIRPDLYVGHRCQPADWKWLAGYFDRVLLPA